MRTPPLCCALALSIVAALVGPLCAQTATTPLKGKVEVGVHEVELSDDSVYFVKAEGKGFRPEVDIRGISIRPQLALTPHLYEATFAPPKSDKYKLVVRPVTYMEVPVGPKDYVVTLEQYPLESKAVFATKGELSKDDPPYAGTPARRFKIALKKGVYYRIDLARGSNKNMEMVPTIFLLDSSKKGPFTAVAQDFGGGPDRNARLIYKPDHDGNFEVVVTVLGRGFGTFDLTVRAQAARKTADSAPTPE